MNAKATGLQSQLDVDVDCTLEKLRGSEHENSGSIGALSSLLGAYGDFWPELPGLERVAEGMRRSQRGFFLFADLQMEAWVEG